MLRGGIQTGWGTPPGQPGCPACGEAQAEAPVSPPLSEAPYEDLLALHTAPSKRSPKRLKSSSSKLCWCRGRNGKGTASISPPPQGLLSSCDNILTKAKPWAPHKALTLPPSASGLQVLGRNQEGMPQIFTGSPMKEAAVSQRSDDISDTQLRANINQPRAAVPAGRYCGTLLPCPPEPQTLKGGNRVWGCVPPRQR